MLQLEVEQLATRLNAKYKNARKPVVVMVILDGAFMFASDLTKQLTFEFEMQFIKVSSYKDNKKATLEWKLGPGDVIGKEVILIDDIADSGETLMKVKNKLKTIGASTVTSIVLLEKRKSAVKADDSCFTIENKDFVYGYGLDIDNGYQRNLPQVYILK